MFSAGDSDSDSDSDSSGDDSAVRPGPFPELEAAIAAAIAEHKSVFPRLNWSAPTVRWGVVRTRGAAAAPAASAD